MTTVLIGIGAAKAGTSWVSAQLRAHPECHLRSISELHYFDALDHGHLGREITKHRNHQTRLTERLARRATPPTPEQAERLDDRAAWLEVLTRRRENADAYLGYLHGGAGEARLVGEITPAYATLSATRFARMAALGNNVRLLYLLRDPVDRLWSHVRMIATRRGDGTLDPDRARRILRRTLRGEETQIANRSDYAAALRRLTRAVPSEKLIVEVFEDVVTPDGWTALCDRLDLSRTLPNTAPVHAGHALPLSPEDRAAATLWCRPQYEAVAAHLGALPARWTAPD